MRLVIIMLAVGVAGCGAADDSRIAASNHSIASSRSAFTVLQARRSDDDVVPSWVVRFLAEGGEPVLSAKDIQGARRVLPDEQGWLVPAPEDKLCLVRVVYPLIPEIHGEYLQPSVSRVCSSEVAAEAGRLFGSQSLSTTFAKRVPTRVDGIVPDGVRYVTIRFAGSASRRVAVVRNAYEVIVTNPRSVSFVTKRAGGRQRYVVPLPSVAGAKHLSLQSRSD